MHNNLVRLFLLIVISSSILTGCPSLTSAIPSFIPSLVPSVNYNTLSINNPNQIQCYDGSWLSSEYCAIPINRFAAISSHYTSPFESNQLFDYALQNSSFVFDNLDESSTLESLNLQFIRKYPTGESFVKLPPEVQNLYLKMKEDYIKNHDFQKQMETYIYLYTLSTIDFANQICNESAIDGKNPEYQQQLMLYKTFSMLFTNDLLHHVALKLSSKYNSQVDLYNGLYKTILDLNPYQLMNMAEMNYSIAYSNLPDFNQNFYTAEGVRFGEIGNFSCSKSGTSWLRFGYQYFGSKVAGLPYYVNFINKDTFNQYDDELIPVK